jgi:hypothetical protein
MEDLRSKINRLLLVVPIIILLTFANVFIGMATAGVVLLQLLSSGLDKYLSLAIAILIAIGVHAYIIFNHKLRNYIKD